MAPAERAARGVRIDRAAEAAGAAAEPCVGRRGGSRGQERVAEAVPEWARDACDGGGEVSCEGLIQGGWVDGHAAV